MISQNPEQRQLYDARLKFQRDEAARLEGAINDERLRGALRVLVENIPGVKNVHDRLAWIEPNSGYLVPASND